ncbi:hypothetical protein L3Q82_017550 [Scortum barcoo]|uniref:Uncharacterized protein n=1 Tax=Scortum barcoo TaxID=214431 RepID=A0ACB8VL24_9TELE|nr:hypothetical protein L3Q82_017550 [Scortum barcoo]
MCKYSFLFSVVRNVTVSMRTDVNLTCSNKPWSEMMFVTWKIVLKYKDCRIAFNSEGGSQDSCNDGKSLRNTSEARSYLHIPNFSNDDIGVYKCEAVYTGGSDSYEINVAIRVPPSISSWLEHEGDKMVAVCKAERGKPAANISWSHTGNSSSEETLLDGFFTVESRLDILEGMDTENLSCIIRHPYWEGEKILVPVPLKGNISWLFAIIVAVITLAGVLFFALWKPVILRRCQQSNSPPSKPQPVTEDVEEVEPYASYVQRNVFYILFYKPQIKPNHLITMCKYSFLFSVVRNVTVSMRTDVNLTCSNKPWSEMMFVTWKIVLKYKDCRIAFNSEGGSQDSCNDGKSLRNTSEARSYLHIPNFSNDDIGVYKCEAVYTSGSDSYEINVAIRVPPTISSWLEREGDKMVAVCKAERGKPAANISWSHTGNSSSEETLLDGFFTVESRLDILEGMDTENLNCIIRHPYWEREKILVPVPLKGQFSSKVRLKFWVYCRSNAFYVFGINTDTVFYSGNGTWLRVLIVGVIIVILVGALYFAKKK